MKTDCLICNGTRRDRRIQLRRDHATGETVKTLVDAECPACATEAFKPSERECVLIPVQTRPTQPRAVSVPANGILKPHED